LNLLITGSSGFIGSHATRYFAARGFAVAGIDVASSRREEKVDIGVASAVDRVIRRFAPDAVLHLGAFASVPGCEADPERCLRTNVLGTLNVARSAGKSGARLVFASTAAVYGDRTPVPTAVTASTQPTNFYGISKLAGEHLCRVYAPDSASLRLFNVYGPGCERSYVIPDVIRKLASRPKVLRMDGTGTEARDFVYIDDVLRAMELALRGRAVGAYNVGTGVRTSVRALAKQIAAALDQPRVSLRFAGARAGDFRVSMAELSGRSALPGWRPTVTLADGLRRVIAAG
jgi:UDP-glucose 4-epimerase